MAKFTWTKQELAEIRLVHPNDVLHFIVCALHDRQNSLTNVYSPLYRKLTEVQRWIEDGKIKVIDDEL